MPKLPRALIVQASSDEPRYEGMGRRRIGYVELPEALMFRGFEIERMTPAAAVEPWRALQAALTAFPRHELLALGEVTGPEWEALGFDVGERCSEEAWSVIAHRRALLPAHELAGWERLLNRRGLFPAREPATRFLARYRECDDPDRDWDPAWRSRFASVYGVVPVHRLRDDG